MKGKTIFGLKTHCCRVCGVSFKTREENPRRCYQCDKLWDLIREAQALAYQVRLQPYWKEVMIRK